jgi:hypothetical protein
VIYATPPVATALSISPARLAIVAPASRRVELRNGGVEALAVEVAQRSLTIGGTPWLSVRPTRIVLRPGARAALTVRARSAHTPPGDHELRLLFTGRPVTTARIGIRLRLGIGVRVRVRGRVARLVDISSVRVRKQRHARVLRVSLVNRGNVTEQLAGRVTVSLVRNGRTFSRLRARARQDIFPGARAVVALRYRGGTRGPVTAVATVALGGGVRRVERRYRLRL